MDESHSLSVAAWSVLALRAGAQAGIPTDPAVLARAVAWIEGTASSIEAGRRGGITPLNLTRARATRALARAANGADPTADVTALTTSFNTDGAALDAEALLFGTLAAWSTGNEAWESWHPVIKKWVVDTGEVGGCTDQSWTVPSVWSAAGGRVLSTALMSWIASLYYRYPLTFTLRNE